MQVVCASGLLRPIFTVVDRQRALVAVRIMTKVRYCIRKYKERESLHMGGSEWINGPNKHWTFTHEVNNDLS